MSYRQVALDVKRGEIAPVYLLFGEEDFLIEESVRLLTQGVERLVGEVDIEIFYADEHEGGEIGSYLGTVSLFNTTRIVITRRVETGGDVADELVAAIPALPPGVYLILTASRVDRRSKLYKTVEKHGRALEFKRLNTTQMRKWLGKRLKQDGIRLTPAQVDFLLSSSGDRMRKLNGEVEKIWLYCHGGRSLDDTTLVDLVGTSNQAVSEYLIFDFVDAVSERQTGRALKLLDRLLQSGRPALVILGMIARQLRLLIRAREIDKGNQRNASRVLGLPEFVVRKLVAQSHSFTGEQLVDALEAVLMADSELKTGKDERLVLELLVVKLTQA